ncbi:DNA repair protein RAD4 isoform X1 [Primulina huaijiensis]|uniref:DNA repair protein RAD4 isoform X1 n=1 Tax=Primulina huaijiensis TaxID=1492673 RepID=UPI003CC6EB2B
MRTRSQSKQPQSTGEEGAKKTRLLSDIADDKKTLLDISGDAVTKLLRRVKKGSNKEDDVYLRLCESAAEQGIQLKENNKELLDKTGGKDTADTDSCGGDAIEQYYNLDEEYEDSDWEDGSIPTLSSSKEYQEDLVSGVSVEFDVSPGLAKRKSVRRATSEEKEVAEIVHKCHLLCLLGRGRLIDGACNDPLIQASLLSLLPTHLLKIAESPKLTASHLCPLVNWFHNNFSVCSPSLAEKTCHCALASTLETREGTPEAVVALCVALFRALNLTTRFVSILDVISLKPDADKWKFAAELSKGQKNIFNSSTPMVGGPSCSSTLSLKSLSDVKESGQTDAKSTNISETEKSKKHITKSQVSRITSKPKEKMLDELVYKNSYNASESRDVQVEGLKRKGDLEFQMQLEMALSATAVESSKHSMTSTVLESPSTSSTHSPPYRRMKKIKLEESQTSSHGISTAIGSRKVGAPIYWAEVFCAGDNLTGKWVHVDVVNAIVDGESKVEAAAAACKTSLRYVVAFSGNGAKDVTRRYCTQWYKVASQRINLTWWDSVLSRLKESESGETGGTVNFGQKALGDEKVEPSVLANPNNGCVLNAKDLDGASEEFGEKKAVDSCIEASFDATLSSLEDMELATRALTEPLPTNQLAYKNHHLYAIERWLKKYQIIYPKGLVLGFCSGHAVYPRTCVQILHTRQMWLREGLQVKADELPAKVLKRSMKQHKKEVAEDIEHTYANNEKNIDLYGKWQTEPLLLPHPVNGIVPKNERGQVEVWSEKCLPPGTVHLPFPRIQPVAKRLGIDFAPAMVGFEYRNDRSFPIFEGIVVCEEFNDSILEAYAEEEDRRKAEERKQDEVRALSRWYQLLSSIVIRQRLNNSYGEGSASQASFDVPAPGVKYHKLAVSTEKSDDSPRCQEQEMKSPGNHDHEHEFTLDEQAFNEDGSTRVKRCRCGFSIQFEEL